MPDGWAPVEGQKCEYRYPRKHPECGDQADPAAVPLSDLSPTRPRLLEPGELVGLIEIDRWIPGAEQLPHQECEQHGGQSDQRRGVVVQSRSCVRRGSHGALR